MKQTKIQGKVFLNYFQGGYYSGKHRTSCATNNVIDSFQPDALFAAVERAQEKKITDVALNLHLFICLKSTNLHAIDMSALLVEKDDTGETP